MNFHSHHSLLSPLDCVFDDRQTIQALTRLTFLSLLLLIWYVHTPWPNIITSSASTSSLAIFVSFFFSCCCTTSCALTVDGSLDLIWILFLAYNSHYLTEQQRSMASSQCKWIPFRSTRSSFILSERMNREWDLSITQWKPHQFPFYADEFASLLKNWLHIQSLLSNTPTITSDHILASLKYLQSQQRQQRQSELKGNHECEKIREEKNEISLCRCWTRPDAVCAFCKAISKSEREKIWKLT